MKKIIYILIVVLILIAGYYFFIRDAAENPNGSPTTTTSSSETITDEKEYSGEKFSFQYPAGFSLTTEMWPDGTSGRVIATRSSDQTTFVVHLNPVTGFEDAVAYKPSSQTEIDGISATVSYNRTSSNEKLLLLADLKKGEDRYWIYMISDDSEAIAETLFEQMLDTVDFK